MIRVYLIVALLAAILRSGSSDLCHNQCVCKKSDTMDCSSKKFTNVPEGYWPNVKKLNISNNDITTLYPHSFTGYPNIEALHLDRNSLSVLDLELNSAMPRLHSLSLTENDIGSILTPSSDLVLNELVWLVLDGNNLKNLDTDLLAKVAPKLQSLDLLWNPIEIPASGPLLNHPELIWIQMSDTDGKNIGVETFAGVPNLVGISLQRMGIVDVTGLFVNYNLTLVYLDENEITEVPSGTVKTGRPIINLSLRKNPLETFDVDTIDEVMAWDLYIQAYLDITDTPIACNCIQYEAIHQWSSKTGIHIQDSCDGVDICSIKKST